jgi:hypothetical protein
MRFITMIMTSAAILLLASRTPAQAVPHSDVAPVQAVAFAPGVLLIAAVQESQPRAEVKVDINTNKGGGGGAWYTQPIWLAVGGLALLVIILIAVMAARGGRNNTTVVK